jgi:hypothetical protein
VTVTVAAGQSIYVSANSSIVNPGANSAVVGFSIAYQASGGTLTNANTTIQETVLGPAPATQLVSLSAVIAGLAPSTYQVGLAGELTFAAAPLVAVQAATAALVFQS